MNLRVIEEKSSRILEEVNILHFLVRQILLKKLDSFCCFDGKRLRLPSVFLGDLLESLGSCAEMAVKCFEEGGNRTTALIRTDSEGNQKR